MNDAIAAYANNLDPQRAAICGQLQGVITELLPQATSKVWHAIPVWFIGENPVVGYTARKEGVMLMFWNGQSFGEPELEASGSFHMAQIAYTDASQVNREKLAVWLAKAGTSIWDAVGWRNEQLAKRRAEKTKAKAKAKSKVKAKAKAKAKPRPKKAAKKKRPARKK